MRVAADGTALELAGAGGASGFVDGSKTIQTTPWILVAFTVASTVVIGLLWGRILSCRVIADAGTFAAPDILSATSNFDGTPSTTQSSGTPGFIRLPAPLSDPRWMILNTTLVYNSSLSASPSWGYYRNNTDFLDIQRSTLLWFDESRVSPLFTNAASTAIPLGGMPPMGVAHSHLTTTPSQASRTMSHSCVKTITMYQRQHVCLRRLHSFSGC